ncbi:ABC transporter substrate-binding protein [Paenibacillus ginsengarvi]|uniref:Extracellular solute-binding protein n=1 Tax=Paenibacillus ginsengarvi TaxID=400777 RepID=A0A3B0CGP3_9BACL|nr:extracellular solute-binding protein [Paenibacillus ginsengarvi]RKN84985.1 extracellular solute-binding protein [Paenibacillus ginsengarvi]
MKMNRLFAAGMATVMTAAALGCSSQGGEGAKASATPGTVKANEPAKPLEPVTLKVLAPDSYLPAGDFQALITDPVKKKYPHLTVEKVTGNLADFVASRQQLDFWVSYNGELSNHLDEGIYTDINPLAKKFNFDLSKFDQGALDVIRQYSANGELIALPYAENVIGLYYNKDIFDKFGVPYPKDGMTWDEAIELSRKLSRQDGGVNYYGLQSTELSLIAQKSLPYIDYKTNNVLVNSEPYKKAFELGQTLFSVPNNPYLGSYQTMYDRFMKDKTVAMLAPQGNLFSQLKDIPNLNWDIVQKPYYKDNPNISGWYNIHLMIPTKMSKYPDDQMRVLEVLFSDEVQTVMAKKTARKSTLKDPKYIQMFGEEMPELKGKNITGMFKGKSGPAPGLSRHYSKATTLMEAEFTKVAKNEKDVNTALRDLEDQIKQYIATQENPKK